MCSKSQHKVCALGKNTGFISNLHEVFFQILDPETSSGWQRINFLFHFIC